MACLPKSSTPTKLKTRKKKRKFLAFSGASVQYETLTSTNIPSPCLYGTRTVSALTILCPSMEKKYSLYF